MKKKKISKIKWRHLFITLFAIAVNYSYAQDNMPISNVKSVEIAHCGLYIETPFSISPQVFDNSGFENLSDTIIFSDKEDIENLIQIINDLKLFTEYEPKSLDTRGRITITHLSDSKTNMYFNNFFLLNNGLFFDIKNSKLINEIYKLTNKYSNLKNGTFTFKIPEVSVSIKIPNSESNFRRILNGFDGIVLVFENGSEIQISIKEIKEWGINLRKTQTKKSHSNYVYSCEKKKKNGFLLREDSFKFRRGLVSISYTLKEKKNEKIFDQMLESIWIASIL